MRLSNSIRTACVLAAALVLAACGGEKEEAAAKPALTVAVQAVAMQPLARTVEASGTVVAWELVPVGAETGGLTAEGVFADEGQYVRQGQVLVKMNDAVLSSQLRQQEAQVASARATLKQASANLERARELRQKGYLAQAALDARVAEQQTAAAQVAAAEAARAETASRRAQTDVRAPVSGLIASRSVVKGQIISPGTELFRIVRDGRLELNAQIPEQQIGLVRAGMPATVTGEGVATTGVVRIVTPQVDPQTRLGIARVSLAAGSGLKPGMFARAVINVGAQPTLVVPTSAVLYRDNSAGVFVVDRTGHARFRPVRVGDRNGASTQILEGLNGGERVVTQGAGFLADGDPVRVAPAQAPAAR
ncbi:MAG TPA: efflux RND transporter periplasmic adaptor subunit [Caulobacteraceae bacterium]|nr:efflux RND transporter periplasmic adaptor subunit [Caulobacteraceae bacterium]